MSEQSITEAELPMEVRDYVQQLHDATPHNLYDVLISLEDYFKHCCKHPAAYAPVLVPALALAFDKIDLEDIDADYGPDPLLTFLFTRLGPTVVQLVRSRHVVVRQAVAGAIAEMGPAGVQAADHMVRLLTDPDPRVRGEVCRAIAAVRPTQNSARLLAKYLDDSSTTVVISAIRGLGEIGQEAAEFVPRLLRFLDPEKYPSGSGICYSTLVALTNLPVESTLLRFLKPLLKRNWEKLCPENLMVSLELNALAGVLRRMGSAARECMPDLEQLLRLNDNVISPYTKIEIAHTLLEIDADNALALETLERVAADPKNREYLTWHLGYIPLPALGRLHRLIEKLAADPDKSVQAAARELLDRFNSGEGKGVPAFKEAEIACALLRINVGDTWALKILERIVTDPNPNIRKHLIGHLEGIHLLAHPRLHRLIENLIADPDKSVQAAARELLDRFNSRWASKFQGNH